jgi:hypothetical protein
VIGLWDGTSECDVHSAPPLVREAVEELANHFIKQLIVDAHASVKHY